MGTFEYLEHTADVIIEGRGDTPADALEGLLGGLVDTLGGGPDEVRPISARTFAASGGDGTETVVNTLSEIIYLTLAEGFAPCRAKVVDFSEHRAVVTVQGEDFDPARHTLMEVKAATFHGYASGKLGEGGYFIRVLFDT